MHEEVVLHGGAPNKNIGDAFLCSWKTEDFAETPRSSRGLDQEAQKRHKLRMRRLSLANMSTSMDMLNNGNGVGGNGALLDEPEMPLEYTTQADQALKAFVDVIEKLRSQKTELLLRKRHARLYMKK